MTRDAPSTTRRDWLAAVAAGGTLATAGCLGGGGGSAGGSTSYGCGDGGETVSEAGQPALGPTDAAVTVQVWEDFSCPHCATWSTEHFPQLREEYLGDGQVRYEHHDFPIPVRDWAWGTASASRAVYEATDGATFFDFVKRVYEQQSDYSLQVVGDAADAAGVDPCTAVEAARGDTYRPVIEADKQTGLDTGVEGTPAVFVNGQAVSGERTFENVAPVIDDAL
ncbi:DsbA family protein [Halobaculum sp. MBLA0143]|uniref:DsbA family protein n=1 Tax=Halobaculum sp. MBLA0143 TaxID=3079933 RepID=UPI0035266164